MDIKYKNTLLFLNNYADRTITDVKISMATERLRKYESGNINAPINASKEGSNSLTKVKKENGLNIEGNSYLEKVDEGTRTESTNKLDILKWMKDKNIKVRDRKGKVLEQTEARRDNLANLIVSKLLENGIRKTNFLTDIIDDSNNKLMGIENSVAEDVEQNIDAIFIKFGFKEKGDTLIIE
jgi:hypothetical protein